MHQSAHLRLSYFRLRELAVAMSKSTLQAKRFLQRTEVNCIVRGGRIRDEVLRFASELGRLRLLS